MAIPTRRKVFPSSRLLPARWGRTCRLPIKEQDIAATLVDLYSLPLDDVAILELVQANHGQVLKIPKSGRTPDEVLRFLQLSASDIVHTAVSMLDVASR